VATAGRRELENRTTRAGASPRFGHLVRARRAGGEAHRVAAAGELLALRRSNRDLALKDDEPFLHVLAVVGTDRLAVRELDDVQVDLLGADERGDAPIADG